jgi:tripartite-type tricarboxylate transporter receptor subunit TctC
MSATRVSSWLLAIGVLAPCAAHADSVADFYKNTPMTLVVPADAGDAYDSIGRLVARHLGDHIPGNPKILVENMGGASGRLAANYGFTRAPRDGSTIIELLQTSPLGQAMKQDGVRYDAAKFNWLGSPVTPIDVVAVWNASGIHDIEDAKRIRVSIGATSSTAQNYIYPRLMNELLGTKFNIVTGYQGGNAINLAMERNEVQGRGSFPWDLLKATKADWIKSGRLTFLAETGLEPLRDAPKIPRLIDLTSDPAIKAVFELMSRTTEVGRPYVMPPNSPKDRVAAVQKAFDDMVKDASFIADAKAMKEDVDSRSGAQLLDLARGIVGVDQATVDRLTSALAGGGDKSSVDK